MKEEDKRSSNDVSLYNTFQNSGHLQAKWGKGLGKTETSFMGGEPFQGVGSEDCVEVVLDVGDTVITMAFDRLGRRVEYQETCAGQVAMHFRFVYDNFLCVQRLNAANGNAVRTEFVWDLTEPIATRPLVMRAKNWDLNLFYTHDGNKNVSELFYHAPQNGIAAHYDYAPLGAVTRTSRATRVTNRDLLSENPFRFSSEYYDFTLDLVYYNHRHYNPGIGRWSGRDPLEEMLELNLYTFSQNDPLRLIDRLGLSSLPEPCPDDIKSRKIYKTSSRIMNGLIYRIYTYRSTTQARSVTTNGCSVPPMFAWLPLASLHMRIFNDACNKHDSCYGRCSSDKTQCDKLFFEDMKNACDQYDRDVGYRAQCKAMASAFYLAVVTRGESYYEDAQDTYCEHHQCSICYTGEENE